MCVSKLDVCKGTCLVLQGVKLRGMHELLVGADGALGFDGVVILGGQLQRQHLLHIY